MSRSTSSNSVFCIRGTFCMALSWLCCQQMQSIPLCRHTWANLCEGAQLYWLYWQMTNARNHFANAQHLKISLEVVRKKQNLQTKSSPHLWRQGLKCLRTKGGTWILERVLSIRTCISTCITNYLYCLLGWFVLCMFLSCVWQGVPYSWHWPSQVAPRWHLEVCR